ncbi:MAG: spore germination protein [Lachnospiraceae bacterium]|nr:spore germination protein [Lachnospiraceae bacterium]
MGECIAKSLEENVNYLNERLKTDKNFDILYHSFKMGDKQGCYYFIDGFCKDEIMQKLSEFFMKMKDEETPGNAYECIKKSLPYPEVSKGRKWDEIIIQILSGVIVLFLDGQEECVYIDARTYPARNVEQPDKEKTLRGSRDGFVETVVCNTALIRRRIRDNRLIMEMTRAGNVSQTDIAVCYMEDRVNRKFLNEVMEKIQSIQAEAMTVNQESLAECLYQRKWYDPFPKFRYTERPDTAAAQLLEGNIVIFTDNSPFAMILPTGLFDIMEEVDDYYFPPITGTYLRISRMLISIASYLITPLFLLLMMYPEWIPESFSFIQVKEEIHLPLIWQFLVLELAIDGLKLAAVNSPNMLTTPLSVLAALILGEFSVKSGWFNAEVMLYMAFVAVATYTQTSYEYGYAVKFLRMISLILTSVFGITGFAAGLILYLFAMVLNRTVSGEYYLSPLIPFHGKELYRRIVRTQDKN